MPSNDACPHAVIERATGILMALNFTDAEVAWAALQRVSCDASLELPALAEATIAIATQAEPAVEPRLATAVHALLCQTPRGL